MRLLMNLKIKYKLIIMLMLPIIGFLGFTTHAVIDKSVTATNMAALEQVTALSIKVSDVVHSIQKERAQSLSLGNNGNLLTEQLSQEYVRTDESIGVLKTFLEAFDFSYYPTHFETKVESMLQTVEKLGSIRTLATKTTETDQILSQYTDLNTQLLDFITTSNKLDNGNIEIFKLTRVYANTLVVREKASLETLVGKTMLTQQQATSDQYQQLIELEAYQTIYLTRNILLHLNETQRTFFEQTMADPVVAEVETMRQTFYNAFKDDSALLHISVENWSSKQDSRAELLKAIEERLATDLHDAASQLRTEAKQSFNVLLSIAIVIILLVIWLTTSIVNNVTSTLGKAVTVAKAIAQRNLNNEIEITGKDETNQLLQELAEMQRQLRTQLEEEKSITQQALRINNALDNATTNVVITDEHFDVIYLNKSAQQLFKTEESVIQTRLPHFNATQLLYSNADKYHKNPQHQHQILDHLMGTHRSRVTIADITLDHIISPIDDKEGNRLGFVIEFHNRSSEVAIEQEINQVIHAASKGNFEQRVDLEGKVGFFKMLGESINKILEVNRLAVIDTMRIFSALAKGDLTQTITRDYIGAFEQLKNDANATVQRLTEVVATIQQTANAVDGAANDISNGNMSLTQRTEEQAASLEQTAASMEQMTSTVQQNADNARQASQLALSAKERAEQGGKVVNAAVVAVSAINSSSQKVADIIGVIDDIAFQTNLLALNAAVEAARAGEQGRGFAVVATEVRHLAQRSATAAKEIKQLIRDSVDKVEEGTKLVNQSGSTLEDIVIAVKKVSDIIAEISAASQEQSAGIHQVNKAITQMDEMTQQNAALVSQAMTVNNVMVEQVKTLQQQIAFFKVKNLGEKKKKEKVIAQNTSTAPILPKAISRHSEHEQGWEDF